MLPPAAALMPCRQPAELARSASRAANADVNPKLMTIEWGSVSQASPGHGS